MNRNGRAVISLHILNLVVIFVLAFASPMSVMAAVWTDKPDYSPGSVVTIHGDNSDGAGFWMGETVQVDVAGPNGYSAACQDTADANGAWSCQVTLWNSLLAVGSYSFTATGTDSGVVQNGAFTDAVGDFNLDFVAAAPSSYNHLIGGGAYDDRTIGKSLDVVESLEGSDFACGDIVTLFTQVVVDDTARAGTDAPQTIEIDYAFLMDTTGQSGVAIGDIVYAGVNYGSIEDLIPGQNTVDDGILFDDGGSVATLISESQTGPMFQAGSLLQGTVRVTDLDRNEEVIVRIDVKLFCQPGANPTGNLQADISAGRLTHIQGAPITPASLSIGSQTIPFKSFGNIHYPEIAIQKTVTTADGVCPGVENLTITNGDTVKYCYAVSNPSDLSNPPGAPLYNVSVVDDRHTPANAADDFSVTLTTGLSDIDVDGQVDDLAAGAVAYGEALVTINETAGTSYTNTATASGADSVSAPNILTASDTAAVALDPTAVTMGGMKAVLLGGQAIIEWTTVHEFEVIGFNIYRAATPDGSRERINASMIPALNEFFGAVYQYVDDSVQPGSAYYWIEPLEVGGPAELLGPVVMEQSLYLPLVTAH